MLTEEAKINANLGTGLPLPAGLKSVGQTQKILLNEENQTVDFTKDDIKHEHTVYFKNCRDCTYTFAADVTCTKIFVESCHNLRLRVAGRIITHTLEWWKCTGESELIVRKGCSVLTLQMDMCQGQVSVVYEDHNDFNRMIWSQMGEFTLKFNSLPDCELSASSQRMLDANPNVNVEGD